MGNPFQNHEAPPLPLGCNQQQNLGVPTFPPRKDMKRQISTNPKKTPKHQQFQQDKPIEGTFPKCCYFIELFYLPFYCKIAYICVRTCMKPLHKYFTGKYAIMFCTYPFKFAIAVQICLRNSQGPALSFKFT